MANEQNLVNLKDRTQRERKEIAKKGAEATNKIKQQRKTLKEELLLLLEKEKYNEKISLALIQEALTGNVRAFETIRDTIGEKPTNEINVNVKKLEDILNENNSE